MSRPRLALVGAGHMGRLHAQKLAELAGEGWVDFIGIHDPDPCPCWPILTP
jgi:predicted dehydrogenase